MSLHGRWQISIPTPLGRQDVLLDIVHREGPISGTATQGDETVPFIDPVADGDRIQWSQRITKPMSMVIKFDLTRDGETLTGRAKPGFLPSISVSGTRVD
ncbi:hypothetical protein RN629_07925 [Sphingomonadaceae bacterium jetA1]|jgi:hypothetical protein|uniref:hypothetical protein n=1 Tax=Facivitalis istanbulensis TaxID=3075838 RepID=UPI003478DE0C